MRFVSSLGRRHSHEFHQWLRCISQTVDNIEGYDEPWVGSRIGIQALLCGESTYTEPLEHDKSGLKLSHLSVEIAPPSFCFECFGTLLEENCATASSTQIPWESCKNPGPLNVSHNLIKTCCYIRKESNILCECPFISSWTYSHPPSVDVLHSCLAMGCCDISYMLVTRRNSPNSSSMEVEDDLEPLLNSEVFIAHGWWWPILLL